MRVRSWRPRYGRRSEKERSANHPSGLWDFLADSFRSGVMAGLQINVRDSRSLSHNSFSFMLNSFDLVETERV